MPEEVTMLSRGKLVQDWSRRLAAAEAGPLLGGIATDEWVVAVSVRDKLNMDTCGRLLQRFGISAVNTGREIKVRHCDLEQATELVRKAHQALKVKLVYCPIPGMM